VDTAFGIDFEKSYIRRQTHDEEVTTGGADLDPRTPSLLETDSIICYKLVVQFCIVVLVLHHSHNDYGSRVSFNVQWDCSKRSHAIPTAKKFDMWLHSAATKFFKHQQ